MSGDLMPLFHPNAWVKCGGCPTMLPLAETDPVSRGHRVTALGRELCGECSDLVRDAEQDADLERRDDALADARLDRNEA